MSLFLFRTAWTAVHDREPYSVVLQFIVCTVWFLMKFFKGYTSNCLVPHLSDDTLISAANLSDFSDNAK